MQNKSRLVGTVAAPAIIHSAAYASNLNSMIGDIHGAVDVISRGLVGFIPVAQRNGTVERAAKGQDVIIPDADVGELQDIEPSMSPAFAGGDVDTSHKVMKITHSQAVPINFSGEEQRFLASGSGYPTARAQTFGKGIAKLTTAIENTLSVEAIANASRAYGTAGQPLFTGDKLEALAAGRQILNDNGAPVQDRAFVMNSTDAADLIIQKNLTRVNEAGSAMTLRQGELLDILGFSVHETGAKNEFVKGTGADATTNAAGYAEGARTITLAAAGTGGLKRGDVISFAGDSNKYVVQTGAAAVSGAAITLQAPGLRQAIPAAATAITVHNGVLRSVGLTSSALQLALRAPAAPEEGDARIDSTVVQDPRSGLVFEVAVYAGYRMVRYEIGAAWGAFMQNPEHAFITFR